MKDSTRLILSYLGVDFLIGILKPHDAVALFVHEASQVGVIPGRLVVQAWAHVEGGRLNQLYSGEDIALRPGVLRINRRILQYIQNVKDLQCFFTRFCTKKDVAREEIQRILVDRYTYAYAQIYTIIQVCAEFAEKQKTRCLGPQAERKKRITTHENEHACRQSCLTVAKRKSVHGGTAAPQPNHGTHSQISRAKVAKVARLGAGQGGRQKAGGGDERRGGVEPHSSHFVKDVPESAKERSARSNR